MQSVCEIMEQVVKSQLIEIATLAAEVSRSRQSRCLAVEDVVFACRRNKVVLKHYINFNL